MYLYLLVFMNILSIIVLAYWLRVYILETRRLPRLIDEDAGPSTRVSIIIPVRNEESRIGKCLDSVLRQRGVVSQVIVVDDSSVDDTRKVVEKYSRRYNVKLIEAAGRPLGSIGKSWSCYVGYRSAENDYLLFIDADTVFLDDMVLSKAIKTLESLRLDYLSLFPKFEMDGALVSLVYPLCINTVILFERFSAVNREGSSKCFLLGAFSLFRKKVYESAGGHMSVLGEVAEDKVMGERLRALGFSFKLFNGSKYVKTLVKPGVNDMWFSVVRFMAGLKDKIKITTFLLVFYLIVFIPPLISLLLIPNPLLWLPILPISLSIVLNSLELSRNGRSVIHSIGYPLAVILVISVLIYVLFSVMRGRIEFKWKDRRYSVKT